MDLIHMYIPRTGRARHNSQCRVTGTRQTTSTAVAAINFGHKLMMVASVAVGVGCRAAIAGTSKSLGASDIVTTVAEEASFSEI